VHDLKTTITTTTTEWRSVIDIVRAHAVSVSSLAYH
jgi:hypothetical protein